MIRTSVQKTCFLLYISPAKLTPYFQQCCSYVGHLCALCGGLCGSWCIKRLLEIGVNVIF